MHSISLNKRDLGDFAKGIACHRVTDAFALAPFVAMSKVLGERKFELTDHHNIIVHPLPVVHIVPLLASPSQGGVCKLTAISYCW